MLLIFPTQSQQRTFDTQSLHGLALRQAKLNLTAHQFFWQTTEKSCFASPAYTLVASKKNVPASPYGLQGPVKTSSSF